MRKLIPLVICGPLIALASCTPQEFAAWKAWYAKDPVAATEFAKKLPPGSAPAPAPTGLRNRQGDAVWNRIARCESGGNWSHGPVTNSSGTYSGGLMIGHRWWGPNGGKQFAEWPYQATRAEQIHVAENIVDEVGLDRGWQCYP